MLDLRISKDLKLEGTTREIIRQVQNARKQADLQVDDRIKLDISTTDKEITAAIKQFSKVIAEETLAVELTSDSDHSYKHITKAKIDNSEIVIAINKA